MVGALLIGFAIAIAIGLFFTIVGWRHPPPSLFTCRRCGHSFLRPGARGYPRRCPSCGSQEWNV